MSSLRERIFKEILPRVSKPTRYLGNEVNSVHKDWDSADVKIALAFPDVYEIGMSHLGIKILYSILNDEPEVLCERVFAPWQDMERKMRDNGLSLFSLESTVPIIEFDILGFSLQYEMCYTNVLNMLDLAGIPLLSRERPDGAPLVIAGGPCVFNPEPMADFIDAFLIGEAEDLILEVVDVFRRWRESCAGRRELLEALSRVQSVYVPALFPGEGPSEVATVRPGQSRSSPGRRITKRWLVDLDDAATPVSPPVPFMDVVHDRLTIEIMRGCTQGCRFCQAGMIYRPLRERTPSEVRRLARVGLSRTGYEEVSLAALSSTDYRALEDVVSDLMHTSRSQRTAISLPSIRPGTLSPRLIETIGKIRRSGFTLAPEAGTERLRSVINKQISGADLISSSEAIFGAGWDLVKLYFMIGLPTETEEDLQGIIRLTQEVGKIARALRGRRGRVNVSISAFVPKAHTPFQWEPMISEGELQEKSRFLTSRIKRKNVSLRWRDPKLCLLEGAFSRGDRRLGKVALKAWELGARFDSWTSELNLVAWDDAWEQSGLSPGCLNARRRDMDERLPWDHIDPGVNKEFLQREYLRACRQEVTPNCRDGDCSDCGICLSKMPPLGRSTPAH